VRVVHFREAAAPFMLPLAIKAAIISSSVSRFLLAIA